MKYNNAKINTEFDKNIDEAKKALVSLSFCQTEEVDKLLKGWVFEQTIVKFYRKNLIMNLKLSNNINFQASKFKEKIKVEEQQI